MVLNYFSDNFVVPLSLVLMVLFYFFKPKKINSFYGYRTTRAMQNQKNWDFAQDYCSRISVYAHLALLFLQFLLYMFMKSAEMAGILILFLWLATMAGIIVLTEIRLKKQNF